MKTLIVKRWIAVPLVVAAVAGTVIGTKLLIDSNLPVKAGEGSGGGRSDLQDDAASDRNGNGVSKGEGGGGGGGRDLKDDAAGDRDGNGVIKNEGGGGGGGRDLKDDATGGRDGNGVSKDEGGVTGRD